VYPINEKMNRYLKRNALFCFITQTAVAISYLRFGTTQLFNLQESMMSTTRVLLV